MLYHYATWSTGELNAQTFGGRVGIYGVAIFYVLSGLTLTYRYRDEIELNFRSLGIFFKKRFFRIFPLLWLATAMSIALSKKAAPITDVLLNLSGLFGLLSWGQIFCHWRLVYWQRVGFLFIISNSDTST